MGYKIAIATSDQIQVDRSFREALEFSIYLVDEKGTIEWIESRKFIPSVAEKDIERDPERVTANACGSHGCSESGGGCGIVSPKVELLNDCRCVVCTNAGFKIQKKLQQKAISLFDVDCSVEEALNKITFYFQKIDHHQSFGRERGL